MASPIEAFQVGAGLGAGQSTLGHLVKSVLSRYNMMQEAQVKSQSELATQRALIPFKTQAAKELLQEKARLFPPSAGGSVALRAKGIAETGLAKLQRIRDLIGLEELVNPFTRQRMARLRTPGPISTGGLLRPVRRGLGLLGTGEKELRDTLESTFDLLALLRTGTAGEESQVKRLQLEKNIGATDTPETISNRIRDMEEEFRGFAMGTLASPVDLGTSQFNVPIGNEDLSNFSDEDILRGAGLLE